MEALHFLLQFANQRLSLEEIQARKEQLQSLSLLCQKEQDFKDNYEEFLHLLGHAYRFEKLSESVLFSFEEAVQACYLAKLSQEKIQAQKLANLYAPLLAFLLAELSQESIDENLKQKALTLYKKKVQAQNHLTKKYSMYM